MRCFTGRECKVTIMQLQHVFACHLNTHPCLLHPGRWVAAICHNWFFSRRIPVPYVTLWRRTWPLSSIDWSLSKWILKHQRMFASRSCTSMRYQFCFWKGSSCARTGWMWRCWREDFVRWRLADANCLEHSGKYVYHFCNSNPFSLDLNPAGAVI